MKAVFEKIHVSPESSILAFSFHEEEFDAPWHFHPEYELTFIKSGNGIRYIGNHVENFHQGDLVLLGVNLPHCWKNTEKNKNGAQSIVLQWSTNVISDLPEFSTIQRLLSNASKGVKFNQTVSETVHPMMENMITETPLIRYLSLVKILAYLATIKDIAFLAENSFDYDLSSKTGERFDKIQQYVKENFHHKIKLGMIAAHVNMTEQSFSRFFSKTMNRPFFYFLNEYRINIARRMLVETDKQVAEIGYDCGYETLPFYYKQFKKFTGYSPLRFRKLYEENGD